MSHGDLPQSVEVLEHAVAGRPVPQLAPFPLIPCSFQAVEELLCICSCIFLLPVERRCVTVGRCFVSFNGEHHLETHHADGFVSPVSRADGDKVHLVRRRFARVVRHFTGQVAFIRKRKSGRKTRQHGMLAESPSVRATVLALRNRACRQRSRCLSQSPAGERSTRFEQHIGSARCTVQRTTTRKGCRCSKNIVPSGSFGAERRLQRGWQRAAG